MTSNNRTSLRDRKSLILHVGMPKCGTSTVQKVFDGNREALKSAGLEYLREPPSEFPDLRHRSTGNANALVYAMFGYKEEHLSMPFVMAQLHEAINNSDCNTVILSHEDFVVFGRDRLVTLKELLAPVVDQITPVIHIRNHVLWMASDYQQHIKQLRSSHSIGEHVGHRLRVLDFSAQCAKFQNVFGSVICRLTSPGMNIAYDFTTIVGHEVPELREIGSADSNTGLTAGAVRRLIEINRQGLQGREYKEAYDEAVKSSKGSGRFQLPEDLAHAVQAYAEPDVITLKRFLSEEDWNDLRGGA